MKKLKTVIYFLVIFVYIYAACVLLISKVAPKSELEQAEEPGASFDEIPLSDSPIPSLSRLASLPPPATPPAGCSASPLPRLPSCQGQPGLTGTRLAEPRRLVLMILFSFEVDTLEIALREQLEHVDKMFIVEATTTTKGVGRHDLLHIWKRKLRMMISGSQAIVVGKTLVQ